MKTLNIKLPLDIAQTMSDNAELNPVHITNVIDYLVHDGLVEEAINDELTALGLSFNYSFKVPRLIHRTIKLLSIEYDTPMNELTGRLLTYYYRR